MKNFAFPARERLKGTRPIKEVFSSRMRYAVPGMRLKVRLNDLSHSRLLVALIRGYGNAVKRNRARRVGREIYRHIRHQLHVGYDLAFVFYPSDDSYAKREAQMMSLCRKAGILGHTGV